MENLREAFCEYAWVLDFSSFFSFSIFLFAFPPVSPFLSPRVCLCICTFGSLSLPSSLPASLSPSPFSLSLQGFWSPYKIL